MNGIFTISDLGRFASTSKVPILFIEDEQRPYDSKIVCFERDFEEVKMIIPLGIVVVPVQNQLDYNRNVLRLVYDKEL